MRITCPSCEAQYEVPEDAIPDIGRDVQCSNCGHVWFELHPDIGETDIGSDDGDAAAQTETGPADTSRGAVPQPATERPDDDEAGDETDCQPDDGAGGLDLGGDPDGQEAKPRPLRRALDPTVAEILREEGERERAARRAERSQPLETQPDLGLPQAAREKDSQRRYPKARTERLPGDSDAKDAPPGNTPGEHTAANGSARDTNWAETGLEPESAREVPVAQDARQPKAEEIGASFRSKPDPVHPPDSPVARVKAASRRARGFRWGFGLTVLIFAGFLALYAFAPEVSRTMPQADPYLSAYVNWVDELRGTLDRSLQQVLSWFDAQFAPEET
jgi:predicted Zn finger-like uncharacterized protein